MRHRCIYAFTIAIVIGGLIAGSSQGFSEPAGRYELKAAGDGYLRLDTRTGSVSHCRQNDSQWRCTSIADDRRAYRDEISKLEADNRKLQKKLAALQQNSGAKRKELRIPSDQELDKVMGFFEKMLERFLTFARKLEKAPAENI